MAQGSSGRVVIDLDPAFKEELYATLRARGINMKQWFTEHAKRLCEEHNQPSFQLDEKPASTTAPQQHD